MTSTFYSIIYLLIFFNFTPQDDFLLLNGFKIYLQNTTLDDNIVLGKDYSSNDFKLVSSFDDLPGSSKALRDRYDYLNCKYLHYKSKCEKRSLGSKILKRTKPYKSKNYKSCIHAEDFKVSLDSISRLIKNENFSWVSIMQLPTPTSIQLKHAADYIKKYEQKVDGEILLDTILSSNEAIVFGYYKNDSLMGLIPVLFNDDTSESSPQIMDITNSYWEELLTLDTSIYNPLIPPLTTVAKAFKLLNTQIGDPSKPVAVRVGKSSIGDGLDIRFYTDDYQFKYESRTSSLKYGDIRRSH